MATKIILSTDDFTDDASYYNFNNDNDLVELLGTYITKFEAKFIYQIFGQPLGDRIIKDAQANGGIPKDPKNVVLFNAININDPNNFHELRQSEGLKPTLMAMVFYEFATSAQYKHSLAGFVNPGVDTAGKLSYEDSFRIAEKNWNEAVEWIKTMQWYCVLYSPDTNPPGDYPDFYGQPFEAVSADFL